MTTREGATSSTFNDQTFWTTFLDLMEPGGRTSDPNYYIDGQATEEDYRNAIEVIFQRTEPGSAERREVVQLLDDAGFWADTDDLNYWINADASDEGNINDLANAGAERLPNLFGGPGGTPGQDLSGGTGPDPETSLTILSSPTARLFRDPTTGRFYIAYKLPNSSRRAFFEIQDDQMEALYGGRTPQYEERSFRSLTNDENFYFSGNVAEIEGDGSFEEEVSRVTAISLGEGDLPEWAEDTPEIRDLIYLAQAEEKSTDWLINQIAQTQSFKARFPNLEKIKNEGNLSYSEAITGFLEFEAGVRAAIESVGGDPDSISAQTVGQLLDKNYSIETAQFAIKTMDRAQKFAPAMTAFNEILVSQGKDPISSIQDMFDFMAGNAPQDVYDIWEASSLSEAATSAGLGDVFSAEDAMDFARFSEGQTTLEDATTAFQSAAQLALRLRNELEIEKFGLNMDDLIDVSLGKPLENGRSAADFQEAVQRAVLSAQAQRQGRAQPFQSFNQQGRPGQQGLSALRE